MGFNILNDLLNVINCFTCLDAGNEPSRGYQPVEDSGWHNGSRGNLTLYNTIWCYSSL